MSTPLRSLIERYQPKNPHELENALKEVIQEITLAGLSRGGFFDKAAFYGGTALRIFHALPRFSEDLDFTLLEESPNFSLQPYFNFIKKTLSSFDVEVEMELVHKSVETNIESAFLKANTRIHMMRIDVGRSFAPLVPANKKLSVKFEVDTSPPLGFLTEVKVLLPPLTSSIKVLRPPFLFAGKMHAVLFRKWGQRVKGRDFYDLLWYIGRRIPLNLGYLESKLREGGDWTGDAPLNRIDLIQMLERRFREVDWKQAVRDVAPFIADPGELTAWSAHFFEIAIAQLVVE